MWDRRALPVELVRTGLAEAVCFPSAGRAIPPIEVLYKKALVLAPGYFEHVDPEHAQVHERLLGSGIQQFRKEFSEKSAPRGFFCLPVAPRRSGDNGAGLLDLFSRIDALRSRGRDVLLFRERELYTMTAFVNR